MRHPAGPVCLLAALLAAPASVSCARDGAQPRRLDSGARLEWVPCWFEPAFNGEARCAHFHPSPDPGGRAPLLPVVILESALPDTRPSPILYLPAGPGSATGLDERGIRAWWHRLELARWPHDLVLFDVRGAGLSRPRLDCPEILEADRTGLGLPLSAREDLERLRAAAGACYRRLRAQGIDPAHYSVRRQAQDVAELMELLGGSDWNLWGVSYGTRLALHVARDHPARVRALVLDSVYPPEVNGLMAKPGQFALALRQLGAVCARDPECGRAHPALGRRIERLMARLARRPAMLTVEKWPGLWRHEVAVNDYRLLWFLFLETYRPPHQPRYPNAIAAALEGRYEPLLPLAETFVETLLDPDFSHGLYYATVCPEDLPGVSREAYLAEARRHPSVARHLLAEWDAHACHDWEPAPLPPRFGTRVASDTPALFLSGAHDTVTLPGWAAEAAAAFPQGRHYTFPESSHAVTWENDCAMALVWEFLAEPGRWTDPPCLPPERPQRAGWQAGGVWTILDTAYSGGSFQ